MNQLFDQENKFWSFFGKLADVTCMSLLWMLTSLPIVTIGASTTAFYQFTLRQVNDTEGTVWASYWKYFRKHFKKATILWLIQLAGMAFFAVDLWAVWHFFLSTGGSFTGIFSLAMIVCLCFLFFGCTYYVYPTLAIFDFPLKKLLANSFIMAVGNLPTTITLTLLALLGFYLFYQFSGLYFLIVGLYIFISSFFIFGVFRKYTGEQAEADALYKQQKREAKIRKKMSRM